MNDIQINKMLGFKCSCTYVCFWARMTTHIINTYSYKIVFIWQHLKSKVHARLVHITEKRDGFHKTEYKADNIQGRTAEGKGNSVQSSWNQVGNKGLQTRTCRPRQVRALVQPREPAGSRETSQPVSALCVPTPHTSLSSSGEKRPQEVVLNRCPGMAGFDDTESVTASYTMGKKKPSDWNTSPTWERAVETTQPKINWKVAYVLTAPWSSPDLGTQRTWHT